MTAGAGGGQTVASGGESAEAVIGTSFEWRVRSPTTPTTATAADVDLSDNWQYDTGSAQLCTPVCLGLADPVITGATATGSNLDWADVADLAPAGTLQIRFTATPLAAALVSAGSGSSVSHVNTADATTDDSSGPPANADGAYRAAADTAAGLIYEADVRLDKEILTAGPYLAGQTVVYRVSVTNDGPDAATGVEVDDVLDGGDLLYSGTVSVDGSYDSGTGRWTLPATIANSATAQLDLQVVIDHSDGAAGGGDDITTTSTVTDGNGNYAFVGLPDGTYQVEVDPTTLPGGASAWAQTFDDDSTLDHRSGDIALTASGASYVDADFSYTGTGSIGDQVWWDVDRSADGNFDDTPLPGDQDRPLADVGVDLVWAGFDGILGNSDDVTYPATSTDSSGSYQFSGLVPGQFRVAVDTADPDFPTGLTDPTWDVVHEGTGGGDGDPRSTVDVTLTAAANRADVDFSYSGTASFGDSLSLDIDGDGEQDAGEPGIGGVTVTVVWFGPDGVVGGGDDLSFTTETAPNGRYELANLPAGTFSVTVDHSDPQLPLGVTPSNDRDGVSSAHTTEITIAAGEIADDLDFGYQGASSIGDMIWLDFDGDGTLNGPEVGLPAIRIEILWAGADGVFAIGDDATFTTTTTGVDGNYGFTGLPFGTYRATVDQTTLADGLAPTFDADSTLDHTTDVTLNGSDPDRADVDFGYRGTASVGDRTWEDLDADGVVDGSEPGLSGVTVTVTHAGPDGSFGSADDLEITVTTDTDGVYQVGGIPAGKVRVRLAAGVPTDHAVVSELDGEHDGVWQGDLDDGDSRDNIDFGLRVDADLAITKNHSGELPVGQSAVFIIEVVNAGPATASGVVVSDTLPAGLTFESASGLACIADGQMVTCAAGDLAPDGRLRLDLTVAVDDAAAPTVTNIATVASDTPDRRPSDNTDTDTASAPLAELILEKDLITTLAPGGTATCRFTVTNLGPSTARQLQLSDPLPPSRGFLGRIGSDRDCGAAGQLVTCDRADPLAAGATSTFELDVSVSDDAPRSITNAASLTSATALATTSQPTASEPGDVEEIDDPDEDHRVLPYAGAPLATTALLGLCLLMSGMILSRVQSGQPMRQRRNKE